MKPINYFAEGVAIDLLTESYGEYLERLANEEVAVLLRALTLAVTNSFAAPGFVKDHADFVSIAWQLESAEHGLAPLEHSIELRGHARALDELDELSTVALIQGIAAIMNDRVIRLLGDGHE